MKLRKWSIVSVVLLAAVMVLSGLFLTVNSDTQTSFAAKQNALVGKWVLEGSQHPEINFIIFCDDGTVGMFKGGYDIKNVFTGIGNYSTFDNILLFTKGIYFGAGYCSDEISEFSINGNKLTLSSAMGEKKSVTFIKEK